MKDVRWTSRALIGASVLRLVLAAVMFVPVAIASLAVTWDLLGLPTLDDDSPIVVLVAFGGCGCGLGLGFATRNHQHLNAVMTVFGISGAVGFGVFAIRFGIANATASGLLDALPTAIGMVLYGIATGTSLIAAAVGSLGLICRQRS